MKFYFAPMEGITGSIYRNAHHDYFPDHTENIFLPLLQPDIIKAYGTRKSTIFFPRTTMLLWFRRY
jgi:tRNA-dihydrouridine synthase